MVNSVDRAPEVTSVVKNDIRSPLAFLELYRSNGTVEQVKAVIKRYLNAVTGSAIEDVEAASKSYFKERGKDMEAYQRDVELYFKNLQRDAPMTQRARLSYLRTYLQRNGAKFDEYFWKDLRRKIRGANRPVTIDDVPTNALLRKVVEHLPIHGRALILVLATSGVRIGEALSVKLSDLDLGTDPARLALRAEYTKGNTARTVFISREAKEVVREWLKVRSRYLQVAVAKSVLHGKTIEDDRLFPFEESTMRQFWDRALGKAGFLKRDPTTGYNLLHPHTLRKFFRTRLGPVLQTDVVEAIVGHAGALDRAYRRYTIDQLADFYKHGEPSLLILSDVGEIEKQLQETEQFQRGLQLQFNRLMEENVDMKNKLANAKVEMRKEILGELMPEITQEINKAMAQQFALAKKGTEVPLVIE